MIKKDIYLEKIKAGLGVSGGLTLVLLSLLFNIFYLASMGIVAIGGLFMVYQAFVSGSFIVAILLLFIGIPFALWLVDSFFIIWAFIAIIGLLVWGTSALLGGSLTLGDSLSQTASYIWWFIWLSLFGYLTYIGGKGSYTAIKKNDLKMFLGQFVILVICGGIFLVILF